MLSSRVRASCPRPGASLSGLHEPNAHVGQRRETVGFLYMPYRGLKRACFDVFWVAGQVYTGTLYDDAGALDEVRSVQVARVGLLSHSNISGTRSLARAISVASEEFPSTGRNCVEGMLLAFMRYTPPDEVPPLAECRRRRKLLLA